MPSLSVDRNPQDSEAPKTQPPNFLPDKDKAHALGFTKTPGTNTVASTTVIPCQNKLTYIWLNNGRTLWSKPIQINQSNIVCWVWISSKWVSQTINLKDIDTFICEWF